MGKQGKAWQVMAWQAGLRASTTERVLRLDDTGAALTIYAAVTTARARDFIAVGI